MPKGRKLTDKGKREKLIKELVKKKVSANKIQVRLKEEGLGLRRKELLLEIRKIKYSSTKTVKVKGEIKKVTVFKDVVSKEKRKRSIPKKYRKPEELIQRKFKEPEKIFRMSFIIRDIPIHSRVQDRKYFGFRLTAFCIDKETLYRNESFFKRQLKQHTKDYAGFNIWEIDNWDKIIYIENPVIILVDRALRFNRTYIFRVEKNGAEEYSRDGRF